MKLTFFLLIVTLCTLAANGYGVPDLQEVAAAAQEMAPPGQGTLVRVARADCNPNTCESNCRWCFNGKCHCDWQ
ncbi:hypothetical protein JYU34_009372 [Plutella xylostella]|uniref:Uncharacterized protein n=1 Tax=Plutella xylostella TaxID=51655 RepID=A0ABQ7QKJ5_PLUXY|nr:hypothetical protein JYU34_009372 [Plutella xylostella]